MFNNFLLPASTTDYIPQDGDETGNGFSLNQVSVLVEGAKTSISFLHVFDYSFLSPNLLLAPFSPCQDSVQILLLQSILPDPPDWVRCPFAELS